MAQVTRRRRRVPQVRALLLDANLGERTSVRSSARLPPLRVALAVKTPDDHNSLLLHLKENSVREPLHSGPSPSSMDDRKLQGTFCDGFDRSLHCQRKAFAKLQASAVVPRSRLLQFRASLGHPDDGQLHGLLNRSDLIFPQAMTSEGFCSRRSIRRSNSARCASVSVSASASRLSQTASSNSAFSADVSLAI